MRACDYPGCDMPTVSQCDCCGMHQPQVNRWFCKDHGTPGGDHPEGPEGIQIDVARPSQCWACGGWNADYVGALADGETSR